MAEEENISQGAKNGLGGLKLIIIIAIVVILVGVGGFFLGKMLAGGEEPKDQEASVSGEVKPPDPMDKKAKPTDGKPEANTEGADPTATANGEEGAGLLVLEKFTVNLNDPFGRRYAEILINLKIDRKSLVSKIQENELILPQIRDEIFMIISSKSYPELNSVAGKVTLKEEIMIRVNELIKENLNLEPVLDVFFGNFIIQ